MNYLKVNWESGIRKGYFIQCGANLYECELNAYERLDYEDLNLNSFEPSNEDEYEQYLERGYRAFRNK